MMANQPNPSRIFALVVLLILQALPITARAQHEAKIFVLPVASVSSLYQINIEQVLRENFRLKLSTRAETQGFRWYFHSGALPLGLKITPNGNIVGRPRNAHPQPYKFKAKVLEASAGSDELVLMFELKVEPSRIQLVGTNAPKLVPLNEEPPVTSDNGRAKISLSDKIGRPWNANHFRSERSNEVTADNTRGTITRLREGESEPAAGRVTEEANPRVKTKEDNPVSASVPGTGGAPIVAASCPDCEPSIARNQEKDFIIDARGSGTTSGKRRFKLHENARIIIVNKNPFLYDYRVSFKEKVIEETAIAKFFEGWPLFDGLANVKAQANPASSPGPIAAPSCSQLSNVSPTLFQEITEKQAELAGEAVALDSIYKTQQEAYDAVAKKTAVDKDVLYNQKSDCKTLCDTATNMRTSLQQYQPKLGELQERISDFKDNALQLQRRVKQLERLAQADPQADPATHPGCATALKILSTLAAGYVEGANDLAGGVDKMIAGKKTFDDFVKTITDVLNTPDAFLEVHFSDNYRKQLNLPSDVEITVERKPAKAEDTKFVKLVDAETINFGGGPRFALAGGVVVSPLETINFKRVPALVNGTQTTIVGQDESSNSRILPILMLHARLCDGKDFISGVHFSLGVTAKPTDDGTNVEFLLGPSISFIEERLFFTFGGYAGRRKQLEGNLVPGQELPKEFTDDIPTSNHLVWKPGFALTYKFK